MSDDSKFCMNCGSRVQNLSEEKVEVEYQDVKYEKYCIKCGRKLSEKQKYCPACGKNQDKLKSKILYCILSILVILVLCLVVFACHKRRQSPIEGVSNKIYNQGMEYLVAMESSNTKNIVISYASKNSDVSISQMYLQVDELNFQINLGKKATDEEEYFSKLITKFWQSWAIVYSHESIIEEYESSHGTEIQVPVTIYKGLVSGFEDKIYIAKEKLTKAAELSDMQEVYEILENMTKDE